MLRRALPRVAPALVSVAGAAVLMFVGACGGPQPAREPAPAQPAPRTPAAEPAPPAVAPDPCIVRPAAGPAVAIGRAAVVGIDGRIDPAHAPAPRNDAERIAFRQYYATLVRVDCAGALRPALARRWRSDSTTRRWTLELDGRFADGTPVTAAAVLASWERARSAGLSRPFVATSPTESIVVVELAEPAPDGPAVLADPALAVTGPGTPWPAATGAFRPDSAGTDAAMPTRGARPFGVRFRRGGDDARDLVDAGIDILVTRDAATIAYAAARPGYRATPLPWDRLYALVVPGTDSTVTLGDELRGGLARDAVRVEARAAEAPYPALHADGCRTLAIRSPRPRVVYLRNDPTARELAARLVALQGSGSSALPPALRDALGERPGAVALEAGAFAASLAAGDDAAYVVSLPRAPRASCSGIPAWPFHALAVPLIDTRATLVLRDSAPPLAIDGDGGIHILPDSTP